MQSRKASPSKRTNKKVNEAVIEEKSVAKVAEPAKKPRVSRSKKEVSVEASSPRNHRKAAVGAAVLPVPESSLVARTLPEAEVNETPKAMSAAAGAGVVSSAAAVIDPAGVVTAPVSSAPLPSREDVAKLAYSYWIARGYSHGFNDEDWLRAEAELASQR